MRTRNVSHSDREAIARLQDKSGFGFKFPEEGPLTECEFVVEDLSGELLAVSAAQRCPEIFLALKREIHPAVKMQALALIHDRMNEELMARGYREAFCFLPPEIEGSYGRHLRRLFHWEKCWSAFRIKGHNRPSQ